MSYTFDDIKGPVTLLIALYSDVNAAEIATGNGEPVVSRQILKIIGALREPLSNDDQLRLDQVIDKLVETKLHAQHDLPGQ